MSATVAFVDRILDAVGPTLETLRGPALAQLKELLADPNTPPERFKQVIPPEQLLALRAAQTASRIPDMPAILQEKLAPLAELSLRELPGLLSHPATVKASAVEADGLTQAALTEAAQDELKAKRQTEAANPRSLALIAVTPMLIGDVTPLMAALRIAFVPNPEGETFDFLSTAPEFAWTVAGLMSHLADLFEQRASLAQNGVVTVGRPDGMAKYVAQMEQALERIKRVAPVYGIVLGGEKKAEGGAGGSAV
jgi:hypothetical protein